MIPATVTNQLISDGVKNPSKKGAVSHITGNRNGKKDFKNFLDRGLKNIKLDLIAKLEDFIKKVKRYLKENNVDTSNENISEIDKKGLLKII